MNEISALVTVKKNIVKAPVMVGRVGKSAYQIAVSNGFIGTEAEWLASLSAALAPEPNDLEIETGTAPAVFSWSVLKAKFAFTTWLAAWKAANLGTAAAANTDAFDAAGAAGGVQQNLNTHTAAVAPHFSAVDQATAEAGVSQALGWWSAERVKQAITAIAGALIAAYKTILGQYDPLPVYTPAAGATVTHPYTTSNSFKLDFTNRVVGETVTLVISNTPAGSTALTMLVKTGASVAFTRVWPTMYAGLTFPTLTANKTHLIIPVSDDGGAHWSFDLVRSW